MYGVLCCYLRHYQRVPIGRLTCCVHVCCTPSSSPLPPPPFLLLLPSSSPLPPHPSSSSFLLPTSSSPPSSSSFLPPPPSPLPPLLFLNFYFSLSLYFSDKDDLSAEMKEFVAVQLFGVQTILGKSTTADCDATVAYDTICRVRDKWAQWPWKLHLNVFLLPAIVQHLLYCE